MNLLCPVCGKPLYQNNHTAVCENHHSFDYAKQGYLNLLLKQSKDHGDNKEMVKARTAFLETGDYGFLRDNLAEKVRNMHAEVLADLGCGEGYYTSVLPADTKFGFDMSKEALKHAAKHDKSTQYAVASIFHLPLPENSCDVCVTCFAPFASMEVERILKPGGYFLFVSPGPKHLMQIKELLYADPYENEEKDLKTNMSLIQEETIRNTFHILHDDLMNLFTMTPYYHRTKSEDIQKLNAVKEMDVTAEFIIRVYKNDISA